MNKFCTRTVQFKGCWENLRIKWEEETSGKCEEGEDVTCMHEKLGYWPENNKKQGNKCN